MESRRQNHFVRPGSSGDPGRRFVRARHGFGQEDQDRCRTGLRRGPFFSPDGQFICYRSDREGNNLLQIQVSKLQMDEGIPSGIQAEFALTADRHVNWAPFFHPSGDWLVYATSRVSHRNYEVFALPLTGDLSVKKEPVRITNANGFDGLPVFSPEGSMMMWTAQRGQDRNDEGRPSSQLWLAKTTGQKIPVSERRQLNLRRTDSVC